MKPHLQVDLQLLEAAAAAGGGARASLARSGTVILVRACKRVNSTTHVPIK